VAITLSLSNSFQFDALNDHFQLYPAELLFLARRFIVIELVFLQSLGQNAESTAIKIEDLELGLA
jgi:hypothetical protein